MKELLGPMLCVSLLSLISPNAHGGLRSGPEYDALIDFVTTIGLNQYGLPADACTADYGIVCDQDNDLNDNSSHIVEINIPNANLPGTLPTSLSGFPQLRIFTVFGSHLPGSIPSLTGLTSLFYFDVGLNKFTGSIPTLSGLTALETFNCEGNQLTGSIPALSGLANLVNFRVNDNSLTGSIPALVGLTKLQVFLADNNRLSGSIPSLSGLTSLYGFSVSQNRLTGTVPSLDGLPLSNFSIGGNHITGAVPHAPLSLASGGSSGATLCPNPLSTTPQPAIDPTWNAATLHTPWWANPYPNNACDDAFTSSFDE